MNDQDCKIYFKWGVFLKSRYADLCVAGFLSEENARRYRGVYPRETGVSVRRIDVPNERRLEVFFRWGLTVQVLPSVEVLTAGFVFEPNAREYAQTFLKADEANIKWIGEGRAPNLDGGFDAQVW